MADRGRIRKLDLIEERNLGELDQRIRRARQHVAMIVHARARDRGIAISGRQRDHVYARIGREYLQLEQGLRRWSREMVEQAIRAGRAQAADDIRDQTGEPATAVTKFSREYAETVFGMVNPDNERSLAAVFTDKMRQDDIRKLRETHLAVFRQASLEGLSMRQMSREMQKRWDETAGDMAAFRFTDNAGRSWENARYLQMIVRTTVARVDRDSYFDALAQHGDDLAQIENVDNEACEICQAWDGVILSINGTSRQYPSYQKALDAGMFHPNCRCVAERVDEDLDEDEIKRQAEAETPDLEQEEGEKPSEFRKRVTAAVAEYSEGFGGSGTASVRTGSVNKEPRRAVSGSQNMRPADTVAELPAARYPSWFEPSKRFEEARDRLMETTGASSWTLRPNAEQGSRYHEKDDPMLLRKMNDARAELERLQREYPRTRLAADRIAMVKSESGYVDRISDGQVIVAFADEWTPAMSESALAKMQRTGQADNANWPSRFRENTAYSVRHEMTHATFGPEIHEAWVRTTRDIPREYFLRRVSRYAWVRPSEALAESAAIYLSPQYAHGMLLPELVAFLNRIGIRR